MTPSEKSWNRYDLRGPKIKAILLMDSLIAYPLHKNNSAKKKYNRRPFLVDVNWRQNKIDMTPVKPPGRSSRSIGNNSPKSSPSILESPLRHIRNKIDSIPDEDFSFKPIHFILGEEESKQWSTGTGRKWSSLDESEQQQQNITIKVTVASCDRVNQLSNRYYLAKVLKPLPATPTYR